MNALSSLKRSRWCCILVLVAVLTACQSEEAAQPAPPAVSVPEQTPSTEPIPEEPVQQPAYTAPLTGLDVEQPDDARPIAVMINNAPAARPQSGLTQADMVYEVLAEGGITRLIAVYQSYHGDVTIGPVRSIRPYLIHIGDTLHALLVHAGGSTDAYSILQRDDTEHLDEITNASAPFWRDSSRKAPHNLYTNEVKLREAAQKKGYAETVTLPTFSFVHGAEQSATSSTDTGDSGATDAATTPPTDAMDSNTAGTATEVSDPAVSNTSPAGERSADSAPEQATTIELRFLLDSYKVGYLYNEATGLYKRQMNGEDHIDLNTGKVLTAANVLVLGGDYKVLDDVGRLSLDMNSGGEAILFQQGNMISGQWSRKSGDVIRFYQDGKEVPFVPGVTYYNIVPNSGSFNSHLTIDGEKMDVNG
ncbi:DUF3048 domain-containing protein [Paenibacillus sp. WLX1005]|uniref:DUF3048 domain-containing protein n=1 Tax=Paenibacillus sp. WLX1005 TaxID=3243766 RepID=UPI003983E312